MSANSSSDSKDAKPVLKKFVGQKTIPGGTPKKVQLTGQVIPKRSAADMARAEAYIDKLQCIESKSVLLGNTPSTSSTNIATSSGNTEQSVRPKLVVHASNAAAFSGLHRYKSAEDGLNTVLDGNAWVVPGQKVVSKEILTEDGKKFVEEHKEAITKLVSAPDIPTVDGVEVPAAVLKFTSMTGVVLDVEKEIKAMSVNVAVDESKPLNFAPVATTTHVELPVEKRELSSNLSNKMREFITRVARCSSLALKSFEKLYALEVLRVSEPKMDEFDEVIMGVNIYDGIKDIISAVDSFKDDELMEGVSIGSADKAYTLVTKFTHNPATLVYCTCTSIINAIRETVTHDDEHEYKQTDEEDEMDTVIDGIVERATTFIGKEVKKPDLRSKIDTKTVEVPIEVVEYYKEVKAAVDKGAIKHNLQVASAVPIPDTLPEDVARHVVIERGNVSEIPSLARFELPGHVVKAEQRYANCKDFKNFTLSGKTDGCIYKGSKLVGIIEVKNRKTRPFAARGVNSMLKKGADGKDMAYDLRQLACYWRCFPTLEYFYLLEVVDSELHPTCVEVDVLESLWNEMEVIMEQKCGELLDKWEQS